MHKPSLWSRDVPQKFGLDRFSRFDVYWIQTDRQTDKQTDKLNLFFYFQYFHLKLKSRPGLTRARKTCIRFLRFKNHVLVCNNLETELSILFHLTAYANKNE